MSHPDHERSFKSHMSHWSLNELFAKYIEIHILEFWPAVSCFEIRKHLCISLPSIWVKREHTIGSVCSDRISRNWLGRSVVQQPLKSLKLSSPGTGKNKKPVCVCRCMCVYVILCLRSYLYLLKPFSISRKCESSPRLLEITSCTDYTVLGLLLTELVFALATGPLP